MFSAFGHPSKIDEEFTVLVFDFIVVLFVPNSIVGSVGDKRSKNEVTFLLSSVALDQEPTLTNDAIKVHLFTIPAFRVAIVKLLLD